MSAKEKRECTDKMFECLVERHKCKYKYRELEILKRVVQYIKKYQTAFNIAINKFKKIKPRARNANLL